MSDSMEMEIDLLYQMRNKALALLILILETTSTLFPLINRPVNLPSNLYNPRLHHSRRSSPMSNLHMY